VTKPWLGPQALRRNSRQTENIHED